MKIRTPLLSTLLVLLLASGTAFAQSAASAALPEWDKLTPQQRETLIAPLRDRWNSDPQARERMLEHGQRWQNMTPQQREQARKGARRFEDMNPEQRERAKALFSQMRDMTPEQRDQLREKWQKMTPEQRKAWMDQHPPRERHGPPLPPPER